MYPLFQSSPTIPKSHSLLDHVKPGQKRRVESSQLDGFILSGDYTETSSRLWVRNKHFLGRFHFALARQRWIPFLTPSPLHLAQELTTLRHGVVIVCLATLGSSRHVPCCFPRAIAPLGAVICIDLFGRKCIFSYVVMESFLSALSGISILMLEISSPFILPTLLACCSLHKCGVLWPPGGSVSLIWPLTWVDLWTFVVHVCLWCLLLCQFVLYCWCCINCPVKGKKKDLTKFCLFVCLCLLIQNSLPQFKVFWLIARMLLCYVRFWSRRLWYCGLNLHGP